MRRRGRRRLHPSEKERKEGARGERERVCRRGRACGRKTYIEGRKTYIEGRKKRKKERERRRERLNLELVIERKKIPEVFEAKK